MSSGKPIEKVVIYPVDGSSGVPAIVRNLAELFANPLTSQIVSTIKFNDVLHMKGYGPAVLDMASEVVASGTDWMIDLKLADVRKTNHDTAKRYVSYKPSIVTVSSCVSAKAIMGVREALPDTMIALVCSLTDISEEEHLFRFGITPLQKILKELDDFQALLKSENPIGAIVSSPQCSAGIRNAFGDKYVNITPGIRSPHMAKDHQEQVLSAYDALRNGSRKLVIGTQIAVGNPANGISPEESQRITLDEIKKFFAEQQEN